MTNDFITKSIYEVSCQTREKNGVKYHFLMNFSEEEQEVLTNRESINVEDGSIVGKKIILGKYGTLVVKEK